MTSPISVEPQPEPSPPPATAAASPSLWLYFILLLVAAGLTWLAFAIQGHADWPGLLVNLAAGLVGSVVILVLIDRRLRASELEALRRLPTRTAGRLSWLVFPTKRASSRYVQRLLIALEPLVSTKVELAIYEQLRRRGHIGGSVCRSWSLSTSVVAPTGFGRQASLFEIAFEGLALAA